MLKIILKFKLMFSHLISDQIFNVLKTKFRVILNTNIINLKRQALAFYIYFQG